MILKYFICIALFFGFVSQNSYAQQLSDITKLTPEDYINLSLPPLDTLFQNARKNPQVQLNEAIVQDETFQLKITKRNWLSFFSIRGGYNYGILGNYTSFSDEYTPLISKYSGSTQNSYSVGAQVAIPINNLFNLRADVKKQKQMVTKAKYNTEVAFDNLKINIIQVYSDLTSHLVIMKSKAEALAFTNAQYKITENDFVAGRISTKTLTDSKAEQKKAVEEYELNRSQLNILILQLEILTRTKLTNK